MKPAELTDHLALIYHDATRSAKVFARRLAKADESAARKDCDNAAAIQILETMGVSPRTGRMERRLSNLSIRSGSTYDSLRSWGPSSQGSSSSERPKSRCPASPATAMEECYAAMA